jgi:hypothetical protein
MDNIVLSWLFGTLAVEIDIVRERSGTTQQDMVAIKKHILDNRKARALYLNA